MGGGSVFDCCKIVSAQALLDEDIHDFEHVQGKMPTAFIPLGCVVTLSGTGAEQNSGGVITDEVNKVKGPFMGALSQWGIDPTGKDELAVALEGIDALAAFIAEMGLSATFAELGADASDETPRNVANTTVLMTTCAKPLTRDEIFDILIECR